MQRLVHAAVMDRLHATGENLYREIVQLAGISAGHEVLVAGCGTGMIAEWLATRTGASVTGVDCDNAQVARAEERLRAASGRFPSVAYQQSALDDLPYESSMFDTAIGEPAIAAAADPERAVAELVRVTRPMGTVVLLQLTWSSELRSSARELVVARLGMRPRLLVEWKQMLRAAGAVDITVADWTDACDECIPEDVDDASHLRWQDKVQIVGRALRSAGAREARRAVARESELLRELARERSMGFSIIRGIRWPELTDD